MNARATAGIAFVLAAGLLSGCASSSDDEASASSTAPAASGSESASSETFDPSDSADPTTPDDPAESSEADASVSPAPDEAPFAADTTPDSAEASADAQLVLVDIRSAAHDGYDRVVLEFSGPGTPGWTAQYADSASRQGSGEEITVDGEALIDLTVTGSAIPMEGDPTVDAGPVTVSGTSVVTDIFNDGTFEGITHVVLGAGGEQPFRVFAAADPARVVIDVQQ